MRRGLGAGVVAGVSAKTKLGSAAIRAKMRERGDFMMEAMFNG